MRVPPKVRLDRELVVQAAAELADAAGGEVSLADLAAHLGVRTPSLYNHISGQAGLRREMVLLGLREMNERLTKAAVGKSADDALLAVAHAYQRFARERPGLYEVTLRAVDPDDPELGEVSNEIVSVLVTVMESYGLRGMSAIHAIRGFRSMLHGFVTLQATGGFGLPIDVDESFDIALDTFIRGLKQPVAPVDH
jgi:AcrR family transcriptional regulator